MTIASNRIIRHPLNSIVNFVQKSQCYNDYESPFLIKKYSKKRRNTLSFKYSLFSKDETHFYSLSPNLYHLFSIDEAHFHSSIVWFSIHWQNAKSNLYNPISLFIYLFIFYFSEGRLGSCIPKNPNYFSCPTGQPTFYPLNAYKKKRQLIKHRKYQLCFSTSDFEEVQITSYCPFNKNGCIFAYSMTHLTTSTKNPYINPTKITITTNKTLIINTGSKWNDINCRIVNT